MTNLIPMAVAALALLGLGVVAGREERLRPMLLAIGALVLFMALSRGFYWNLFGRGQGFFTANRTSAILVFAAALLGPTISSRGHNGN